MLKLIAAAALAASASMSAPAGRLQPMDLFDMAVATDPQIRPDGGSVAYVRTVNDVMTDRGRKSIWLVDTRTGEQTPLGAVDGDAGQPRWSPRGDRVAFTAKPEGGQAGLYVHWVGTGRTARIASLADDPSELAWSRDGTQIAFLMHQAGKPETLGAPLPKPEGAKWAEPLRMTTHVTYRDDGKGERKPGWTHVYVIPATGGAARAVTTGDFDDAGPLSWTADGSAIVFSGRRGDNWEREPLRTAIYRVSTADGALAKLTEQTGPEASAEVSPDGRLIAFSGYEDTKKPAYANRRIYVMDVDGRNLRTLAGDLDNSLDHPHWAKDGRSLLVQFVDHGVSKVGRVSLSGGGVQTVAEGLAGGGLDLPYAGGEFTAADDGAVAFTQGSPDHPADIAVTRGGKTTRLTHLNDALLDHRTLGRMQHLPVVSSLDKAPVDAWVVTPPGYDPSRRYPLVLEIHGGPFLSYGPTFATDDQLYAAAGYVVLFVNPRGSTGYGEKFAEGIDRDYPGADYTDLMSAVDAAVAKGLADPDKLYVTGGSGGGVLTAWIVGKTHRFKAAVSQKPVVNWSSEVLTSDLYAWMPEYWLGKLPWEDPQFYWSHSPISLAPNVTTPTLVIVGDRDLRTPDGEAEQLYGALKLRGVPTGLIKVPGAFHNMAARPSHSAAKASAVLAWFARYGGPQP